MKRRTFLTGAFAGTAALAFGVNLYVPTSSIATDDIHHRVLFSVFIPIFLDGSLPEVANHREMAINRTLEAISQSITHLPQAQQDARHAIRGSLELQNSSSETVSRHRQTLYVMFEAVT